MLADRVLKNILNMPGLEPELSRQSMLSECAYHLRYIPVDPSAHSISGPDLAGLPGFKWHFRGGTTLSIMLFGQLVGYLETIIRINISDFFVIFTL